jgi:crotonobetainyl-CoA:carnitine CoA-transferase CaiB-like acyl-CoA transferase
LATKYAKVDARVKAESQMEIYPFLEKWAADKTKEQVAQIMDAANIINQPVWNSKEVANHPHWQQRGAVRWIDDPTYGDLMHQGPAYHLSATPPRIKWSLKPVGADNEYILGKLAGLSSEEIKRLEEQECI